MRILAIDPGSSSGALAWYDGIYMTRSIASSPLELYGQIEDARDDHFLDTLLIENVGGSRPGNSAGSGRTFATHLGHLEMAAALLFPRGTIKVAPITWMRGLLGEALPHGDASKADRKNAIHAHVEGRIGKCTKRCADAAGILLWAMANEAQIEAAIERGETSVTKGKMTKSTTASTPPVLPREGWPPSGG